MDGPERADNFFSDAELTAEEMRRAFQRGGRNLATCRAHEVIELVVNGLLSEMNVEYPRTHHAAPILVRAIRQRHVESDPGFLDWLGAVSKQLAEIQRSAFNHEIKVVEAEARSAVEAANRVLVFGQEFLRGLREGS